MLVWLIRDLYSSFPSFAAHSSSSGMDTFCNPATLSFDVGRFTVILLALNYGSNINCTMHREIVIPVRYKFCINILAFMVMDVRVEYFCSFASDNSISSIGFQADSWGHQLPLNYLRTTWLTQSLQLAALQTSW